MQQSEIKKAVTVALLGDSTIHNDSYVPDGHTVMDYVWAALDKRAHVVRYARDGAVLASMPAQVQRVNWEDTTHMVVSISGNDLLGIRHKVYSAKVDTVETALLYMRHIVDGFDDMYGQMAMQLSQLCDANGVELALCTVYRGAAWGEHDQKLNEIAVSLFNDRIRALCWDLDIALIDSNTLFSDSGDFANPIEPSAQGGFKFAHAVREFVEYEYPDDKPSTRAVFAGFVNAPEHIGFPELPRYVANNGISWNDEDYGTATVPLRSESDQTDDAELLLDSPVDGDPIYGWAGPPVEDAELQAHGGQD